VQYDERKFINEERHSKSGDYSNGQDSRSSVSISKVISADGGNSSKVYQPVQ
jgi:hypothetical protein